MGTKFTQTNCEDSALNGTTSFSLRADLSQTTCSDTDEKCKATDCCSSINCENNDGTVDGITNSSYSASSCPVGYVIRSSLSSVGCKSTRCAMTECCSAITCSSNNGNTHGSAFDASSCGGSGWTLKSNQEGISCNSYNKMCSASDCCDPPITCANNNGQSAGVTKVGGVTKGFDSTICISLGGIGYTLKTEKALTTYDCTSNNKQCTALICCDSPILCSNNDGRGNGWTGSGFQAETCKIQSPYGGKPGYTIKSYLTSVSCSQDSTDRVCTANECCDLITCKVNDGKGTGIMNSEFQSADCGNGQTIKENLASIVCEATDEKCTASDCCSSVTCANNDGSFDGTNDAQSFSSNSCPNGYFLKGTPSSVGCDG